MSNPSASGLDLAAACPPSFVLQPRAEETGPWTTRGVIIHEYARRVGENPNDREAALSCVLQPEWKRTCSELDLESAIGDLDVLACEPAYSVDAATGNVVSLGTNIGRDYSGRMRTLYNRELLETEFNCSLDVEGRRKSDGVLVAADYKTGVKTGEASELRQTKLQSYALCIKYDVPECEVRLIYISENGSVHLDRHTFSRMELDGFPAELLEIRNRISNAAGQQASGVVPTVNVGDWCRYCAAVRSCPAQTNMIKTALLDLTTLDSAAMLSPEQIGFALGKVKAIGQLQEKLEKSLKNMVAQMGSVPAGPGYEYRESETTKTYMPQELVKGKLIQLGATQADILSMTRISQFKTIRRLKVIQEK